MIKYWELSALLEDLDTKAEEVILDSASSEDAMKLAHMVQFLYNAIGDKQ